jgi:hypothetical protein
METTNKQTARNIVNLDGFPQPTEEQITLWQKEHKDVYLCECAIGEHATYPVYFKMPDRYVIHLWLDASGYMKKRQDLLWQNCVLDELLRDDLIASEHTEAQCIIVSATNAIAEALESMLGGSKYEINKLESDGSYELVVKKSDTDKKPKRYAIQTPTREEATKHTDLVSIKGSKVAAEYLLKPYLKSISELKTNDTLYFTFLRAIISLKVKPDYSLKKL